MKHLIRFLLGLFLIQVITACQSSPVTLIPQPTLAASVPLQEEDHWPTHGWKTSTPAEQGIGPDGITKALEFAQAKDLNLDSLLVIRNGFLVSETYFHGLTAENRHELYSCTKSFISTLVGIAVDQGRLDGINHKVSEYFPELLAGNSDPRKANMTLANLLTMTTGLDWQEGDPFYQGMQRSSDWAKWVLDLPMRAEPGSQFNYCSGCSYVISMILQRATDLGVRVFAEENLFKPLGINDYRWDSDGKGVPIGGWGLKITPRDMAKLGYLFLNQGRWEGRQIVSEAWVKAATQKQTGTGGNLNYGYQWWVEPEQNAYSARGRYGQAIYVVPALDLVVVTTAYASDDGGIYEMIRNQIIPAVHPR